MNKGNVKLWLLAGLVLFVAGSAIADYNVRDHSTHKQNASTGQRVNDTGDIRAEVVNGPETFVMHEASWLSTRLTARLAGGLPQTAGVFVQDSTNAQDVRGYNGLALFMYPTFDDSVSAVALALQVRWHYSETVDSSSTYIEEATKTFTAAASATARDSIGSLLFQNAASNGVSRYTVGATDSLATPDEQVVVLTNVGGVRPRSSIGKCWRLC